MPISPKPSKRQVFNNTSNVDIDKLYNQYILTIDGFRSRKLPELNVTKEQNITLSKNEKFKKAIADANRGGNVSSEPEESRASAFYRMIGFPVTSFFDGTFYNPGAAPNPDFNHKLNVNDSLLDFDTETFKKTKLRETEFQERIAFLGPSTKASLYVEAMNYPRSFSLIDVESTDSSNEVSKERENQINKSAINLRNGNIINDASTFPNFVYKSINHRLDPFFCNPFIDLGVTPASNRICVPFLKNKEQTNFTQDISLKRPILELIIISRLSDTANPSVVNSFTDGLDEETLELLLIVSKNTEERTKILNSNQTTQTQILISFSNILNSLAIKFKDNINSFNQIRAKNNCYVEPGEGVYGLEDLNKMKSTLLYNSPEKIKLSALRLEQTVTDIEASKRDSVIGGIQVYAGAAGLDGTTRRDFTKEIAKRQGQIQTIEDSLKKIVRENEIISGEVSGLGLIDIFSIYSALWLIPIETLVGFLDLESIQRLQENFKTLSDSEAVQAVINNRNRSISAVYKEFSDTLSNILKNVDSIVNKRNSGTE